MVELLCVSGEDCPGNNDAENKNRRTNAAEMELLANAAHHDPKD